MRVCCCCCCPFIEASVNGLLGQLLSLRPLPPRPPTCLPLFSWLRRLRRARRIGCGRSVRRSARCTRSSRCGRVQGELHDAVECACCLPAVCCGASCSGKDHVPTVRPCLPSLPSTCSPSWRQRLRRGSSRSARLLSSSGQQRGQQRSSSSGAYADRGKGVQFDLQAS